MTPISHTVTSEPASTRWRTRLAGFLTHVLIIGILFILPEALSLMGRPLDLPWQLKLGSYAKSLIYILVFYASYYLILPSTISARKSIWRIIPAFIILIAAALLAVEATYEWMEPYWHQVFPHKGGHRGHRPELPKIVWQMRWMIRDLVMLVLTIALSIALKVAGNWKRIRQHTQDIQALRREQELASLKSQLNPHFLFNTLNTIYALIAVEPDKAQSAVHELSSMLRYVLYEDSARVPLHREVSFIRSYVGLMSMRMGNAMPIKFEADIDPSMAEAEVPPLIFIALIENVFKHGNTGRREDGISISIVADDGVITCRTENAIAPETDTPDGRHRSGGIGLQNLRRRLALLYGNRATLLVDRSETRFTTHMTININD